MSDDLASRLRALRDAHNWTVADMAERTSIPKRTLDKYMLRSSAIMPGFEALTLLSKGLGVSLDWLVFGREFAGDAVRLIATKAAASVAQSYFEMVVREYQQKGNKIFEDNLIVGMDPQFIAYDLASRVGTLVKEMARDGVSKEELLRWEAAFSERLLEHFKDHADRHYEKLGMDEKIPWPR